MRIYQETYYQAKGIVMGTFWVFPPQLNFLKPPLKNIFNLNRFSQFHPDFAFLIIFSLLFLLQADLDLATDFWGVKVVRIDIKNVKLPKNMQHAMSSEAMAKREAKAKLIAAKGESEASKALTQAGLVLETDASAIQLRYLQTLTSISDKNNNTLVVPFPIEIFQAMVDK